MLVLGKVAAWAAAFALAQLPLPALATAAKPRTRGHFLTNSELGEVDTVACLEAKQKNPGIDCRTLTLEEANRTLEHFAGHLSAGNYPNYKDAACNSNGEYFCDPSGVFSQEERLQITKELQRLRRANPVTCPSIQPDPVDSVHLQPFYLGVVVAKDWPLTESDPESLQQLGQIIESQWNMDELYVGNPIPSHKCANTAMLIVMPDKSLAYLSSGSCQFICQAEGGGKVVARTLKSLDSSGAAAGVLSGIQELYSIVSSSEASPEVDVASAKASASGNQKVTHDMLNTVLQVVFAIAIVLVVVAVLGAVIVLLVAPGLIAPRRKSPFK
mmetsp:Transcript_115033/g.245703  ORF Transcript_115033/g.245703 Transcript_115033/m.245703 type:complete len:328 (-) Transcript_115033:61-1044(-)